MQRIQAKKLSDVIVEQIESMILDGKLIAGQRLPAERDLAEQFDVSRPSLREAIQKLEAKGLVNRKQGGGTFVQTRLALVENAPLLELIAAKPESQFDLLEFRHALEGMAAYYAALRGTPQQVEAIQAAFVEVKAVQQQQDIAAEAKALAGFYLEMIQASQNMVLLHIFRGLQPLLQDNIRRNLEVLSSQPQLSEQINRQRLRILDAIVAGDPEQARRASNEHLAFIEETLLNINRQDSRTQRSLRRIEMPD
ncbi:pyruvate dehydrogenase complex transcriptional repressor PdhR [Aliiglaciecola sp. CAU 1673]|uniref:pyruvate dehydrogenase complex transcriptional repressor PdhR n=1 Tax=Aliiglaciecola sp. CAU 1673 TaxID=3032595 RepID=UPI0023DACDEE|nr:pyruvate dehydrogenase complex transcriptional repressor PdhR [Aliiglaciecola sp. CAU 1673]MDF2178412.1 pyruvate dehydrogenase complex transcriptional repressor PdhR [Aliiglaciecola sp. CAU 1673]